MESKTPHILIIRSATRILNPTLAALKQEFPDAKVTLLVPKGVEEAALKDPLVDEVLTIRSHRRMSVFSYGLENLKNLRKRKFDIAVALYNVDHGLGYSNIDALAWASGAHALRGTNPRGVHVPLTGKSVIKKWFLERSTFLLTGLNFLVTLLLFAAITLGLIAEWTFRKLFASSNPEMAADLLENQPSAATAPSPDAAKALTRV